MSVHFLEIYMDRGKAYCIECNAQIIIQGHSRGCTRFRAGGYKLISETPILKYFDYEHLRPELQEISHPFKSLAMLIETTVPTGAEKSAGLRKLLEAKDCIVRAALDR